MSTLLETMEKLSTKGTCYYSLPNQVVQCTACAHNCIIKPGQKGICRMRCNRNGELRVQYGYVTAAQADPIEKKPFAHFMPGSIAMTFGMMGCNFHCDFCQNWISSQMLKDEAARVPVEAMQTISAQDLVNLAVRRDAQVMVSSYNEPIITVEWAYEIFTLAKAAGLKTAIVSNGFATAESLAYLQPVLDGFKIDLKAFTESAYKILGGRLQPVMETIQRAVDAGLWVEVVTLLVPGFNDNPAELRETAHFLASVSTDIPWHLTAYYPAYMQHSAPPTTPHQLQQAAEIGQNAGLHYVYAGNRPGRVGSLEDTFCPQCKKRVINRRGYHILEYKINANGQCAHCKTAIAGIWSDNPQDVPVTGELRSLF
ncbi:MAG: AmmeMemoRadiSam system radical SAM enzyme [Anaerolineaceae bacterium]|nr:AmmeMemoRadiSam system radical SAM enzyme [Anaerolineaceae bacterium]